MFKEIVSAIASPFINKAVNKVTDKVVGVPTPPDPLSPSQQGIGAREFMDMAYPGTTSWERLGAGGGGSPGAVSNREEMRNQIKMQEKELDVRERIAHNTNIASVIAAASPAGAQAMKSAALALNSGGTNVPDYDNSIAQGAALISGKQAIQSEERKNLIAQRAKVMKELQILRSGKATAESNAQIAKVEAEFARLQKQLDLINTGTGAVGNLTGGITGGLVGGAVSGLLGKKQLVRRISNQGRRPSRMVKGYQEDEFDRLTNRRK